MPELNYWMRVLGLGLKLRIVLEFKCPTIGFWALELRSFLVLGLGLWIVLEYKYPTIDFQVLRLWLGLWKVFKCK